MKTDNIDLPLLTEAVFLLSGAERVRIIADQGDGLLADAGHPGQARIAQLKDGLRAPCISDEIAGIDGAEIVYQGERQQI